MNSIDTERFKVLMDGYLQQTLAAKDLSDFFDMLKNPRCQSMMEEAFTDDLANNRFAGLSNQEQVDSAFRILMDKIVAGEQVPVRRNIIFMKRWTRVAAAVIVAAVIGVSSYFIFQKHERNLAVVVPAVKQDQDIAPGGNKAILLLSDGSSINLDSAHNGSLAIQAGTEVIKNSNGQVVYRNGSSKEVVYNSIVTPKGGQYQVTLPDGSNAWLNSLSSIKFPTSFAGRERNVEITGEVYFEIAHNRAKPFVATINNMKVEVLGTHFNVNAYPDETTIQTTLLQGSVKVSEGDKINMLKPGQQARLDKSDHLEVVSDVDLDQVIAWKNGFFNFNKADIGTIMRQIVRWYDIEVDYSAINTKELFWGGIDKNLPLSSVLRILEKNQVHFRMEGKKLVLLD
ncbi:MAG TPA: FecR domain-containing protein [Chitinophagaceae bacterium]